MDALHWWRQGDVVTQGTALVLLSMSVASWVVIVWKLRLLQRASVMLPIPGTSQVKHVEENVAASRLRLTKAELKRLS